MLGSNTRTRMAALAAIGVALASAIATPAWAGGFEETGWGFNRGGQLGDETNIPSDVPVPVKDLSGVVSVSGGGDNNMAVLSNGTVMGFGVNGVGELCDGTHTKAEVPVPVDGVSEAAAVAVGAYDTLILLRNGTIMGCGGNHYGQLGIGVMGNDFNVARPVPGLSGVTAIAAQGDTSLALLSNGTVMAWGKNDSGQLGDGNQIASDVPVPVAGLHNVVAIAAGRKYSLALLSNGTVMSWGGNETGQLGNGTTTSSDTPVPVRGLTEVTAISAGTSSLALLKNGTVMSWGENRTGQLGDGNIANSDVPVPVGGLRGVGAVSSGSGFDLALLGGGAVMGWGENFAGQLGDGNTANSDLPVPVTGLKEVAGIVATSGNDSFAYGPSLPSVAAPVITEVNAKNGPASGVVVVTITGSDFTGATAVKFGSTSAPGFSVKSASSITAVSPAEPERGHADRHDRPAGDRQLPVQALRHPPGPRRRACRRRRRGDHHRQRLHAGEDWHELRIRIDQGRERELRLDEHLRRPGSGTRGRRHAGGGGHERDRLAENDPQQVRIPLIAVDGAWPPRSACFRLRSDVNSH
jgi:alpha-tubulin suppressor-like RCC1 family protein